MAPRRRTSPSRERGRPPDRRLPARVRRGGAPRPVVRARPERVWAALRSTDFGRSPLIGGLLALRALPSGSPRRSGRAAAGRARADADARHHLRGRLRAPRRAAGARAGARPRGPLLDAPRRSPPDRRAALPGALAPGLARAAWDFRASRSPDGRTRLTTETRVRCADAASPPALPRLLVARAAGQWPHPSRHAGAIRRAAETGTHVGSRRSCADGRGTVLNFCPGVEAAQPVCELPYSPTTVRNILCVFPRYTPSFGTFHHSYASSAASAPSCRRRGCSSSPTICPNPGASASWTRTAQPATTEDFRWADAVLVSGMHVQRAHIEDIIAPRPCAGTGRWPSAGRRPPGCPEMYPDADYVHVGEIGDATDRLIELLDTTDGRPERQVLLTTDERLPLSSFPMPAYDLISLPDYFLASVQFSSGCPFTCEFCDIPALYGRNPRLKTPAAGGGRAGSAARAAGPSPSTSWTTTSSPIPKAAQDLLPHVVDLAEAAPLSAPHRLRGHAEHRQERADPRPHARGRLRHHLLRHRDARAGGAAGDVEGAESPAAHPGGGGDDQQLRDGGRVRHHHRARHRHPGQRRPHRRVHPRRRTSPSSPSTCSTRCRRRRCGTRLERAGRIRNEAGRESNVDFLMPYETVLGMWRHCIGAAYEPGFLYARYAHQQRHTFRHRLPVSDGLSPPRAPPMSRRGIGIFARLFWRLGVRGHYRRDFWRMTLADARHRALRAVRAQHGGEPPPHRVRAAVPRGPDRSLRSTPRADQDAGARTGRRRVVFDAWGRFVHRHRWAVLLLSALTLIPSIWLVLRGGTFDNNPVPRFTESGRAIGLIERELPKTPAVLRPHSQPRHPPDHGPGVPGRRRRGARAAPRRSPRGAGGHALRRPHAGSPGRVSRDGQRVLATVELKGGPSEFSALSLGQSESGVYPELRAQVRSETLEVLPAGRDGAEPRLHGDRHARHQARRARDLAGGAAPPRARLRLGGRGGVAARRGRARRDRRHGRDHRALVLGARLRVRRQRGVDGRLQRGGGLLALRHQPLSRRAARSAAEPRRSDARWRPRAAPCSSRA